MAVTMPPYSSITMTSSVIASRDPAEEAMERFPGPVLILHGDADDVVPVEGSREAAERYRQCQLAVIPGETHHYDRFPEQMTRYWQMI